MQKLFLFLPVVISFSSFAQFKPGFDEGEAIDLIRICNSQTFIDIKGTDREIIPNNFNRVYSSTPNVMDNMFQVYKKRKVGIIHFRGSTAHPNSWIENVYSAMIPAEGKITVYDQENDYVFARSDSAAVHSGFALGVVLMIKDVISQIKLLHSEGINDIIITGHSQGGALAIMTHAYLENLPKGRIDDDITFKMYAFANPMVGNTEFAEEYERRFTSEGMSIRIINPDDLIPAMPMTYRDGKFVSSDDVVSWITGTKEFNYKELGVELIMRKFKNGITSYINKSNQLIDKLISKQMGDIILPDYVNDIQYVSVGDLHKLESFEYPEIIKDSVDISEDEFKHFKKLPDGRYKRKEPSFYQHKPYNYYVGILKKYAESEYRRLGDKYLVENL
ncbi:MAG: lipase family protein [Brumimicrobium sp.]